MRAITEASLVTTFAARAPTQMRKRSALVVLFWGALGAVGAVRAQTCHLTYGGGPLIPNVQVVQIFLGTTNNLQYQYKDELAAYYDAVTNSPYFDWLREYNTTGTMVGRGGLAATYADSSPPAGTTIDEATVLQPYLSSLIDGGLVPAPDPNMMYVVHLPGTVQVHGIYGTTCVDDCAYHFFYNKGGSEVRYAVIPDQNSGPCSTLPRCPLALAPFDRLTIVASHELVEAVTDPEFGPGWNDNSPGCGEIGDICRGQPGMAAGYVVQLEWSNKNNKCIDQDPSVVINDFSLALNPATAVAPINGAATVNLDAMPANGAEPTALTLTAGMLPIGVEAAFAPASLPSNASSVLTLTVPPTLVPGNYPFAVSGKTADGIRHSVSGMLTVQSATPDKSGGGGCSTAGASGGGAASIFVLLAVLAAFRRRRSRRLGLTAESPCQSINAPTGRFPDCRSSTSSRWAPPR